MNGLPPAWKSAWLRLGDHLDVWGKAVAVGMPAADLNYHAVVLGTTGSGKSTLLRNLVLQYHGLGGTAVVIEPHGDLILKSDGILAGLSPAQLANTTVLDVAGSWVPQLNLATADLVSGIDVAVQSAMSAIRAMEDAGWHDVVRVREVLDNTLRVLLNTHGEDANLMEAHRFLTNSEFRSRHLDNTNAQVLVSKSWWDRRLPQWNTSRQPTITDILEPSERRLAGFLRDERFRHTLALPPLVPEMRFLLDPLLNAPEPHLVLVPLQAAKLGDVGKRIFGTLLMQLISHLFMRRAGAARRPTMILIDEFPDLAGAEIGEIVSKLLAQARKFGAAIVLAAQSLSQLPPQVRTEVKLNTSTKIILQTAGEEDAEIGSANLGTPDLVPAHLMNVEQYYGYARTVVNGQTQPPFYFRTLPPQTYAPPVISPHRLTLGAVQMPDAKAQAYLGTLHRRAATAREAVIQELVALDVEPFQVVVRTQAQINQYLAHRLLQHPEEEPDIVERALKISRAKHGLPVWLLEAQFRRLEAEGVPELKNPKPERTQKVDNTAAELPPEKGSVNPQATSHPDAALQDPYDDNERDIEKEQTVS